MYKSDDMVTQAEANHISYCNYNQECIDSYQGMTAGTYYLKGKATLEYVDDDWQCKSEFDDGEGNWIDPEYNSNKATLLRAYDESNCNENDDTIRCYAPYLDVTIQIDDYSWHCEVGSNGYSECYER